MRVVFMGTPAFSIPTLQAIIAAGHDVVACYTRAPKPAGRRGLTLTKSPVHEVAEARGVPVFTPRTLREEAEIARFAQHAADVAVVVAYGLILPKAVLDAPRDGCLNLHASLLPRWRGAAPIQRAIMAGDSETGVMVMRMEEGLDTGPVAMTHRMKIEADATAGEVHDALSASGAELVVRALAALARGELVFTPQSDDGVVYAHKIEKAETHIDWSAPAKSVHDHIRGLSPFPGAWFEGDFGRGSERVKVLRSTLAQEAGAPGALLGGELVVACGEGAVRLLTVQRAGGKPVSGAEFVRGLARLPVSFA
ncbi:MAG: methionyl-tRNA formyltransferase [Beijerinckiaceae bacterium]